MRRLPWFSKVLVLAALYAMAFAATPAMTGIVLPALAPLGARVTRMPFTPERILMALKKV